MPAAPDVVSVVGGGGKSSLVFRLAHEIAARGQRSLITTTTRISARQVESAPAIVRAGGDVPPWSELAAAIEAHGFCLLVGNETLLNGKQAGVSPAMVDCLAAEAARLRLGAILVEADGSRTLPVKAPAEHEPVIPQCTTLLIPMLGLDAIGAPIDEEHMHRPERIRHALGLPLDGMLRLTPEMAAQLLIHPIGGAKGRPVMARLLPVLNKADAPERLALGRLIASQLTARGQPALLGAVGNEGRPPIRERWAPVSTVVLAAGASSRMGRPKQVEVVDGEAMVVRAVRLALESSVNEVVVVTGAHVEAVSVALADQLERHSDRLRLAHNSDWASGQAGSIATGLHALGEQCRAAIFMPVDQPYLPPTLLRHLIVAWRSGSDLAAPVVAGALRGAPAIFDRRLWDELLAVQGDAGGRGVLIGHQAEVAGIPVVAAALRDIDTPEDA
jgi:molybdenum cofactor cytidylyltransferase